MEADLEGYAIDTTVQTCRDLIWIHFLKPNYYDQGISAYWLDETDGEGTGAADGEHGYDTSWGPAAAYNNLWVGSWLGASLHCTVCLLMLLMHCMLCMLAALCCTACLLHCAVLYACCVLNH